MKAAKKARQRKRKEPIRRRKALRTAKAEDKAFAVALSKDPQR